MKNLTGRFGKSMGEGWGGSCDYADVMPGNIQQQQQQQLNN